MKRPKVIALSLVAAPIAILGLLNITSSVSAKRVRLNTKDLRENRLLVIAPADPSFEQELAKLTKSKSDSQKYLIDSLKPFSVFVRNEGSRAVIAYALRWDVMQADGTMITHLRTYAEPSTLLGRDMYQLREVGAIKPHSTRYISIMAPVGESPDEAISAGIGSNGPDAGNATQIQQVGAERNETALVDSLSKQLSEAESLTVSLDAAIFDDGTSVGPDLSGLFAQIQAEAEAQDHLLKDAWHAVQRGTPLDQVFNDVAAIANQPSVAITGDAPARDYYNFYKREFANEVLQMRTAIGDDRNAMWYVTRPLRQPRFKLHKQ